MLAATRGSWHCPRPCPCPCSCPPPCPCRRPCRCERGWHNTLCICRPCSRTFAGPRSCLPSTVGPAKSGAHLLRGPVAPAPAMGYSTCEPTPPPPSRSRPLPLLARSCDQECSAPAANGVCCSRVRPAADMASKMASCLERCGEEVEVSAVWAH